MHKTQDYKQMFEQLSARYQGADPDALIQVLCPILTPIRTLDLTIVKEPNQGHYHASFTVDVTPENRELMVRGRTGKFVPGKYASGGRWSEIAKGRIIHVDHSTHIAYGEIYVGGTRAKLEQAISEMSRDDLLEIDQYGAAAKVLSGLVEYALAQIARASGFTVRRMPEDMARHLGQYAHYDFELERGGMVKRVEVKSLWGTNTEYARLIHSLTKDYATSSCKFEVQDIFAVSLFLRTGDIRDFAFARSVPDDVQPYGLPRSTKDRGHVHQNPTCHVGDGTWFATIDEVWDLP